MSFLTPLIHEAEVLGKGLLGKVTGELAQGAGDVVEQGIVAFVKTDVGKLTVDACAYVSATPGTSGTEAREAAKAKLKADAKAAGHDLEAIGEGLLNLFIEMGYNYLNRAAEQLPAIISAGIAAVAKG